MVDRIDLLIAVAAIVVTIVGSSTAQWIALSQKADKDDLRRLEERMDARFDRFESRFDRLEDKFDALILRFVPEQLPHPEN
jgi:hypothetical protein